MTTETLTRGRDAGAPAADSPLTLREARGAFFARMGIAPDGGYYDNWVKLKAGPIPFAIPNTAQRRRSVRLHDLHHILGGYSTDWIGEGCISAFEIGGGCADHFAAWGLNLGGLLIGLMLAPAETFASFVRGRRSRNLYRTEFSEALLDRRVRELREDLGLDRDDSPAGAGDLAAFAGWVLFSLVFHFWPIALGVAWWLA